MIKKGKTVFAVHPRTGEWEQATAVEDADGIMVAAAKIAADNGYVNQHGNGSIPQLLAAIVEGKAALWFPDGIDEVVQVAERLDIESDYPGDAFYSLANALRATAQRRIR